MVGASEPDRDGLAARSADRVVVLGPGPASESYLRDDIVVQAALGTGCDAIHPGYGFLSESPRLARRAREHGVTFVGPPTDAIALAGDKLAARSEAERAGAPVLPGGELNERRGGTRARRADRLPGARQGGRRGRWPRDQARERRRRARGDHWSGPHRGGSRVRRRPPVRRAARSRARVTSRSRSRPTSAALWSTLGERDCSVQRRFQKLIEEAPAPALPSGARGRLLDAAIAVARAIGYANLGTVEFVLDADTDDFFFLEVNCRIQVEHPVTEAVTGRDLVALQLRIADGEPLGFTQEDVQLAGHAVECRLNAEDVTRDFQPSPGRLSIFSVPELPGLRVDTHCFAGAVVPPYYDSLLAKLIGHGDDREQAIDLLLRALEDLDVEGVETNRTLLTAVLGHPDFRAGPVTTGWLQEAIR